jgi:hypothetical protein
MAALMAAWTALQLVQGPDAADSRRPRSVLHADTEFRFVVSAAGDAPAPKVGERFDVRRGGLRVARVEFEKRLGKSGDCLKFRVVEGDADAVQVGSLLVAAAAEAPLVEAAPGLEQLVYDATHAQAIEARAEAELALLRRGVEALPALERVSRSDPGEAELARSLAGRIRRRAADLGVVLTRPRAARQDKLEAAWRDSPGEVASLLVSLLDDESRARPSAIGTVKMVGDRAAVLDVGWQSHEVDVGERFDVRRNGRSVATLRAVKVERWHCLAEPEEGGRLEDLAVGDIVESSDSGRRTCDGALEGLAFLTGRASEPLQASDSAAAIKHNAAVRARWREWLEARGGAK